MGCDGGSIPRRDEMVKLKKKAEKADRDVELMARWMHCALSGEELKQPIVACDLGRLYNKETVIMALLDKSNMPEIGQHIRSLKDVTVLQLTLNPSYKPGAKADAYNDTQAAQYVCPVTGLEMSGRYRFAYIRGCGCVVSEKALKEVPSETCHKCGRPFSADDVVMINVGEDEEKLQRQAMEERRRQARLAKRKRKAVTSDPPVTSDPSTSSGSGNSSSDSDKDSPPPEKKQKLPPSSSSSSSSSESRKGKSKLSQSKHSVAGAVADGRTVAQEARVTAASDESVNAKGKVTEMAQSRKAYKSLFNSHAGERPKERTSHWVTFFPYH